MVKQKIWGSILIYTKNRLVLGLIIKSNYIYIYIYGSAAQAYSGYHAKNWWSFQHFWWPSKEPCKNKANPFLLQFKFTKSLQLRMCMGQVKGIIWPNPPWWVKKNLTQPNPSHKCNPTHMDRVRSGWTHELDKFIIIIIIIIIIKLSRKKI